MDKKVKMKTKFGNFFFANPEDVEKHIKNGSKVFEKPKKKQKKSQTLTSTEMEKLTKKT